MADVLRADAAAEWWREDFARMNALTAAAKLAGLRKVGEVAVWEFRARPSADHLQGWVGVHSRRWYGRPIPIVDP